MIAAAVLVDAVLAVALAAPLAGFAAKKVAKPTVAAEKGVRQIQIDDKHAGQVYLIQTAANVATTVELPEDFVGAPMCGDCAESGKPVPAGTGVGPLYWIDVYNQARYLVIRPRVIPGPDTVRSGDHQTTLMVRLEHATLTMQVKYAERRDADSRVVFVYPNRPEESEYLRVEKAKLEAEMAAKIEAGITNGLLRALSEPHHCTQTSKRERNEDLVVEVNELCYFGSTVYIVFTVENRGRVPAELGTVVVNKGSNAAQHLSNKLVEFQKTTSGVVSLTMPDKDSVEGPYQLTVYEGAGKKRIVTVTGLKF